jgi:hypothetical protein
MHDAKRLTAAIEPVDDADWLKTAGIIFVFSGHFGYFFVENDRWWSVFGRFAAPVFFFLLGYARSRRVPLYWIWVGVALTVLESWNADWEWVAPNILLSFALIRLVRPYTAMFLQAYGWIGFVLAAMLLAALAPVAGTWADYGTEGWLWALFGLCQRRYADANSADATSSELSAATVQAFGLIRLAACLVAVAVYLWQEQQEFSFAGIYFAVFVVGLPLLSILLCLFQRGPSGVQPPHAVGAVLRFVGRHTLEIYALQLAGSELITLALDLDP